VVIGPVKPWTGWAEREVCERYAQQGTHNQSLAWFEAPKRRYCYEAEVSMFTLWLCYAQNGTIDPMLSKELMPDCRLLHLDRTAGHRGVLIWE
jgi:hypothetical protein